MCFGKRRRRERTRQLCLDAKKRVIRNLPYIAASTLRSFTSWKHARLTRGRLGKWKVARFSQRVGDQWIRNGGPFHMLGGRSQPPKLTCASGTHSIQIVVVVVVFDLGDAVGGLPLPLPLPFSPFLTRDISPLAPHKHFPPSNFYYWPPPAESVRKSGTEGAQIWREQLPRKNHYPPFPH